MSKINNHLVEIEAEKKIKGRKKGKGNGQKS